MKDTSGTDLAPAGQVWVCGACGKRARSQFGFDAAGKSTKLDRGWDESCMLNSVLCYADKRDGVYVAVEKKDTAH